MALPINKELILEKHCPSMSLLYLDDMGRAFRKRILTAMEEFANAKIITEAEWAQKLVDVLEIAKNALENSYDVLSYPGDGKTLQDKAIQEIGDALQQYNAASPDRPCPHCGKELNRDRNLCCRACGKEVEHGIH